MSRFAMARDDEPDTAADRFIHAVVMIGAAGGAGLIVMFVYAGSRWLF